MFQLLTVLSFAVSYLVRVLLFEERVSHFGPWPSKNAIVRRLRKDEDGLIMEYEQPVTFFDRVRQFFTRCYDIDKKTNEWYVREDRMEMWTCPKCLSFWVAGAVVIPYLLLTGRWKDIPLAWVAVSGGSYLLYRMTDFSVEVNNEIYMDGPMIDAMDGDDDHEEV